MARQGSVGAARLMALAAVVFWGISFVATKAVVAEISPWALVFARSGIGSLLLVLFVAAGGKGPPARTAWPALAVMGFVGVALHQTLQAVALTTTTAVHSGWLIGLTPIWSALLSVRFAGERVGRMKSAGLALGFLGAALVVTRGTLAGEALRLPSTRGDLLIIASTFNWAVYSVLGRGTLQRLGPLRATAGAMVSGWAFLLPPFLARRAWTEYAGLSVHGWAALLFLGIACSGLGYLLWFGALERIEPARVSSFLYLEPLVTLGAAVVLLNERVTWTTLVGGALLLAGVGAVQWAPRPNVRE